MARLFVLSGASIGTTLDLEGTSVIGRGGDADLVLREPSISREHARLVPREEPGTWKVIDLDSSNGVHVDGKRVRSAIVHDGETFTLGDIELRLRDEAVEPAATTAAPDPRSAPTPAPPLEEEIELEFGDDLDEALASPPKPRPQAPPPASKAPAGAAAPPGRAPSGPAADRAGARASQQRDARRKAALGGGQRATGGSSVTATATGNAGKPVLHYARTRRSGIDLQQLPGWMRALVIAAAIALAVGIAYGAFTLTRTARSQASTLSE